MSKIDLVVNGHFKQQKVTGVQRYAIELIKEFDKFGVDYTTVDPPEAVASDSLRQLWMQTVMPFKIGKRSLLWSPTNIGPIFHENQVITLHDIADQLYPGWFSSKYVNWRRLILPRLLRNVKGIITVSKYSKQTILEKYPEASGKLEVIYNGVRSDHFYPRTSSEIAEVKRKYNLQKKFIITVGSLDPRKNINGLIKAWNLLPSHVKQEFDLVIVGGSMNMLSFKLKEKVDTSVHLLGYVDHEILPALYSASEFFVYPSLFEGFGLPILEAMACKTPVITSNTTSLEELAADHAQTIDPRDPQKISEAIQQFVNLERLRSEYAAKGYKYAQSFTWANSAQKTLKFLKAVANGKSKQ